MNRIRWAALSAMAAIAALSLAGCKKEAVVARNESAQSVANKVAASDIRLQPGRWESTMKIEKMDVPNMPAQARAMMDKQMNISQTFATCLTPEQAAKPAAGFFQKGAQGCKYDHFVMAGGRIDSAMTCDIGGHRMTMAMAGTYGDSNYDIRVTSHAEMQPGMPMTTTTSIESRRVGDCNGSEEK
jgi:hypothetical protein